MKLREIFDLIFAEGVVLTNTDKRGIIKSTYDVLGDLWNTSSEEVRGRIKDTGKWVEFKPRKR